MVISPRPIVHFPSRVVLACSSAVNIITLGLAVFVFVDVKNSCSAIKVDKCLIERCDGGDHHHGQRFGGDDSIVLVSSEAFCLNWDLVK